MNSFPWLDAAATTGTLAVLNGIWPGLLVVILTWALVSALSNRLNATTRYAVWCTAFLVNVGFLLMPPKGAAPTALQTEANVPVPLVTTTEVHTPVLVEAFPSQPAAETPVTPQAETQAVTVTPPVVIVSDPAPVDSEKGAWITLSSPWMLLLFWAWFIVAMLLISRVVYGLYAIRRLKRNSHPVPPRYAHHLQVWLRQLKHPRRVQVRASEAIDMPVAVGLLHPHILIPSSMLDVLEGEDVAHVLLHELAHLQRRDDWANLIQQVLVAVFFFHPGMRWLSNRMQRDREFACDDWVVALSHRPHAYASCLARLAALHVQPRQYAFASGISNGKKQLFDRVKTVLDRQRTVSFKLYRWSYGISLLVLVGCLVGFTSMMPALVMPEMDLSDVETKPAPEEPESATSQGALPVPDAASATDQALPVRIPDLNPVQPLTPVAELASPERPEVHPAAKGELSKASWIKLLKAFTHVASSGDKSRLLREAAGKMISDGEVFMAYIATATTIAASGDQARALRALIDHHRLGVEAAVRFVRATGGLSSSSDRARLLRQAIDAKALPLEDDTVVGACRQVIGDLSGSNQRRASEALNRQLGDREQ